jgi:hypothetical protein
MDIVVATYLIYLGICIPVVLFVGWTLHRNGRVFLVEIFDGKEHLADSINHLLIVGFYLSATGFVSILLSAGTEPADTAEAIESLSILVGGVLFVLGGTHLLNMVLLSWARKQVLLDPIADRVHSRRLPAQ